MSFQYRRTREESAGSVRGRLDISRYAQMKARRDVPKRYPVHGLHRYYGTAENVLVMYAAAWARRELATIGTRVLMPARAAERAELEDRTAALSRALHNPYLADATDAAEQVWRRGDLSALLDEVEGRIEGGHIASPQPYSAIVGWARSFSEAASIAGGEVEWTFYDHRFDPRLFEIWLLDRLACALERALGVAPEAKPLWDRNATPTYTWKLGTASIRIHFQWALSQLSQPTWERASSGRPLEGVPDITVILAAPLRGETAVLIDAKLRQRDAGAAAEIYKLLGYFHNRGAAHPPVGAIVYYSPGTVKTDALTSQPHGVVLELGVDPVRGGDDDAAFDQLAEVLLTTLDSLDPVARSSGAAARDLSDANTAVVQAKAVGDLLERTRQLGSGSLAPFMNILSQTLPTVWNNLGDDVRTILASAAYFGATAPEGADLSGPLLGLCAAVEKLLCDEGAVFSRLQAALPDDLNKPVTLGIAGLVKRGRKPKTELDHKIRQFLLEEAHVDGQAILALSGRLVALNLLRRAAAHTEVVLTDRWREGHATVFGTGESTEAGLLAHVVAALGETSL